MLSSLAKFVKLERKKLKLNQIDFAQAAGVALNVVRKIEQGKQDLNVAKVNQVLLMFGHVLGPIKLEHEKSDN